MRGITELGGACSLESTRTTLVLEGAVESLLVLECGCKLSSEGVAEVVVELGIWIPPGCLI
jgi:hypothetical protein